MCIYIYIYNHDLGDHRLKSMVRMNHLQCNPSRSSNLLANPQASKQDLSSSPMEAPKSPRITVENLLTSACLTWTEAIPMADPSGEP